MNHKDAGRFCNRTIITGGVIIMVSPVFEVYSEPVTYIIMAVGLVIALAGVFVGLKYSRCPNCKKYLDARLVKMDYCPKCGKEL